ILYLASYFNFILQSIEVVSVKTSFLYKSWIFIMSILIGYAILIYLALLFFDFYYFIPFVAIRVFIFILTAVMLWQCFKLRHLTFQKYILFASLIYFCFGIISFATNMMNWKEMLIHPAEWLVIGSFIDIVFFSIALNYRNKKIWENYNKVLLDDANQIISMQNVILEKQSDLENERTRIAADMHDDLGSGLTKITYLSQMALHEVNAFEKINKINKTSVDLIENLSDIIWAMKQENDALEDLLSHIKIYAVDYFELNNINLKFNNAIDFQQVAVNGDIRRNIYLSVKEIFHNIVKHSKADTVVISIRLTQDLSIIISDNGVGVDVINLEKAINGNGFKNIKARINKVGGSLKFENLNGTTVTILIPLIKLTR
ncbi:ATP-binding protein, partial [Flavobacterium sp.]|uniref:sensor histidine kinase n=1 Tax=Flavobacterium sp. TaxID=239 RepID=UPI0025C1BC40